LDAGTQTIVHDEPHGDSEGLDTNRLLDYNKPERNAQTYVGTPRDSTKRNSIVGDPSKMAKDTSLERLDQEAMSLDQGAGAGGQPQRNRNQINITN